MSTTWAMISVKQEDGSYKSICITNDGYVENPGVGYILNTYYHNPETINKLVNSGDMKILLKSPAPTNAGYRVGIKQTVKELLDYCMDKGIDYLYVYEDGAWQWTEIIGKQYKLVELTSMDTLDKVDADLVDVETYCSYRTAVRWQGTNIVLMNNITELDPEFNPYEYYYVEDDEYVEFFQYYVTDLSDDSVEWLRKTFPSLVYAYSEKLNSWVLCVDHYGTSWDYVATQYIGDLTIDKEEFDRFNSK